MIKFKLLDLVVPERDVLVTKNKVSADILLVQKPQQR
jgi:hypothetical protein